MKSARRGKPRKGEDRALTKEAIIASAIDLIDEVGLDKFSVRLLAQRMNVFPAAIYWWIPTRDRVLAYVVNEILVDVMPDADPSDWRGWLRQLLELYRTAIMRHPNVAPLLSAQLLSNAGANYALTEKTLAVLHHAGFRDERLLEAHDVVVAAKVGFVSLELAGAPTDAGEDFPAMIREQFESLDPAEFPLLAAHRTEMMNQHFVTRWDNGSTVPLNRSFDAHVYTVLEGLRMLLTR